MNLNYEKELNELKKMYELNREELCSHYELRFDLLIYAMKEFIKIHKEKNECDEKLCDLDLKLKHEEKLKKEDNFDLSGSCCEEDEDDDE